VRRATPAALDVVINVAATSVEAATGRRIIPVAHALLAEGFLVGAIGAGITRGLGAGPLPVQAGVGGFGSGHGRGSIGGSPRCPGGSPSADSPSHGA
jgi:hypothetical protein